jgi:hypothetical protein
MQERQCSGSQKSTIKPFEVTSSNWDLKATLLNWRREQAITRFGNVLVRTYGPNLFMSDEIVERIIVCAHWDKLKTAAHILKETHWCEDWVDDYADSLLALIKTYSIPLSASTSVRESTLSSSATPNVQKQRRAPPRCSRCKQEGHIGMFICWPFRSRNSKLFLIQLLIKTVQPKLLIAAPVSLR